jgi:hypothetical protein
MINALRETLQDVTLLAVIGVDSPTCTGDHSRRSRAKLLQQQYLDALKLVFLLTIQRLNPFRL